MSTPITHLKPAIEGIFMQLNSVLLAISASDYTKKSDLLKASIGQHVRHIIELFIELNNGYHHGIVNYENRARDHRIETDRSFAALQLQQIAGDVEKGNRPLLLEAGYQPGETGTVRLNTDYYRELAYNIEHSIHHMALIRIGVNELPGLSVEENFGVAPATIKYRQACAQ